LKVGQPWDKPHYRLLSATLKFCNVDGRRFDA
jgi:hypothetical protein